MEVPPSELRMVYFMENPNKKWMIGRSPPWIGNLQMIILLKWCLT
jgi:hypothetical protein